MTKPLLFLFFYSLFASNLQSITFTVDNPSLEVLIAKIESQTDYKFAYGNDINLKQVLSGHFSYAEADIVQVLNEISRRTPYSFQIVRDNITIVMDPAP